MQKEIDDLKKQILSLQHLTSDLRTDIDHSNIRNTKKTVLHSIENDDITFSGSNNFDKEPKINGNSLTEVMLESSSLSTKNYINYGKNWVRSNSSPNKFQNATRWAALDTSSTGQYQTALAHDGFIYRSDDWGNNWKEIRIDKLWSTVGISDDGSIQTAVDISGHIYTSSDYGLTWNLNNTVVESTTWNYVAISSDGVYQTIVVDGGIGYRSSNTGDTWVNVETLITETWSGITMSSDGIFQTAIVNNGSIYTSNNRGVTWTANVIDDNDWISVSMSSNGKYQTALNLLDAYISSDFGITWTQSEVLNGIFSNENVISNDVNTMIPDNTLSSVTVSKFGQYQSIVTSLGKLYYTETFGNTWLKNTSSVFPLNQNLVKIVMSDSTDHQTIISDTGLIIRTENRGLTWTTDNKIAMSEENFSNLFTGEWATIAISDNLQYQTFVMNHESIYTSRDSGVTFTQVTSLSLALFNSWLSVAMSGDGKYQTACGHGIIATSNNYGVTWKAVNITGNILETLVNFFGSNSWISIAMSNDGINQIICSNDGKIIVSIDGGETWNLKPDLTDDILYTGISCSNDFSIQSVIGYKINNSLYDIYVYVSIDSGVTWLNTFTDIATTDIPNYISVSPTGVKQAFVVTNNLYKSIDSGANWVDQSIALQPTIDDIVPYLSSVDIIDNGKISVCEYNGYIHYYDGTDWSLQGSVNKWIASRISRDDTENQTAISGGGIVWNTSNTGTTWTKNSSYILLELQQTLIDRHCISSSGKYQLMSCALYTDSYGLLFNSDDFGNNWKINTSILPQIFVSTDMSATGQYQVAASIALDSDSGFICLSTDYGVTFNEMDLPRHIWICVKISASGKHITAISLEKVVYVSNDGGENWNLIKASYFTDSYLMIDLLMSANGQYQTITTIGYIYNSYDHGITWTANPILPNLVWLFGAMSANGKYQSILLFANVTLLILKTDNYGKTWLPIYNLPYSDTLFYYMSMDSTGQYQSIIGFGTILNSSDYGNTFVRTDAIMDAPKIILSFCTSSSGNFQSIVTLKGDIYTCLNYESRDISTNYEISNKIKENILIERNYFDSKDIYRISSNSGTFTVTLPEISSLYPTKLRSFIIVDNDGHADINNITIVCNPNDVISSRDVEDSQSYVLFMRNMSVRLISDGVNKWYLM